MRNRESEEKRRHSTPFVPYSCYECRIPEFFMNVPMHWHIEFEIDRVLDGRGEFICGDEHFTVCEGDIVILPPNMLHAASASEGFSLAYNALVFNPAMLGTSLNDRCTVECIRPIINGSLKITLPIGTELENYEIVKSSVDTVFTCAESGNPRSDLLMKSELLRLFWLLESSETLICRSEKEVSYSEMIRPALEFMIENYSENISVNYLAELVHTSKSYFMACFKKAVGIGAIEHLIRLRINAACEALSRTDSSISEIALSCGYSNLSNFNRQFKSIVGCSPTEYRKNR